MSSPRLLTYIKNTLNIKRQEAIDLIVSGRILVNNKQEQLSYRVLDFDVITEDGLKVNPRTQFTYLAFNKPVGITCTNDSNVNSSIVNFLNYKTRIYPVGRLDKDSCGLILLTDDGAFTNMIINGNHDVEKEYLVRVDKKINQELLDNLSSGVLILGVTTKPCKTFYVDEYSFRIILTQGLNRQIRRMCKVFGYEVCFLKRIRIQNVYLDIKEGEYRPLTSEELSILKGQKS